MEEVTDQVDWSESLRRFAMLAWLEPRLWELWWLCATQSAPNETPFCARAFWIDEVKPRLAAMVGPARRDDPAVLRSVGALHAATAALFEIALHLRCRGCDCS